MSRGASSRPRLPAWLALSAVVVGLVLVLALLRHAHEHQAQLARRLLSSFPQDVESDPALVRFAEAQARPLYARNCAGCHGAEMQGNTAIGAPAFVAGHWLWGNGSVFQIERILLYGIRSGQTRGLNVTDMPAFGLMGRLADGQIHELVQYLMKLTHRPYDAEAANAGESLFRNDQYGCYDCHGSDAKGESDYGAPDLAANYWYYGGSEQSIHDSIYYGRHGVMPAWQGRLSLEQIRALAVYLHTITAHGTAGAASSKTHGYEGG